MDRADFMLAGRLRTGGIACAWLALLTAVPALAQTHQAEATGSVSIEQPVGASFAQVTSNQALTAVFQQGPLGNSGPNLGAIRSRVFAYMASIASPMGRGVVNSDGADEASVQTLALNGMKYGQPFMIASADQGHERPWAILVIVNFN